MKCPKCGKSNKEGAKFCVSCGKELEEKIVLCPKCGKEMEADNTFCASCGAKVKSKKDLEEPWNFDSKIITITFYLCAIFTSVLLTSPGFLPKIDLDEHSGILGLLLTAIGILLIVLFNKNKKPLNETLNNLKKLKLDKNQIGILFIFAGILTLLQLGSESYSGSTYVTPVLIVFCSFVILCITIIVNNKHKFYTIGQIVTIILSIFCFVASIQQDSYGNELNSSYENQFESIWETGTANPGNEYLTNSKYLLIAGIVFLVLFVVITICKKKKNE